MLATVNDFIEYGNFFIVPATWDIGDTDSLGNQRHPVPGELIYCRIFDEPKGMIGPGNYYGDSQTHVIVHEYGEDFFCLFPGDPGGGHTDTPVPEAGVSVELMSFEAIGRDGQVLLEWTTATEVDNLGFHIEKSTDASTFLRITDRVIAGVGDSEIENSYTYVDKELTNGITYYYNLITVDRDGAEKVVNEEPVSTMPTARVPAEFSLGQNYPNPFNPNTEVKYSLAADTYATLKIFNVFGQEIITLVDNYQNAGSHTVSWNGHDSQGSEVSAGIYFCTMEVGEFAQTRKMVLLR